jgi:aspartyl aminopeptidase
MSDKALPSSKRLKLDVLTNEQQRFAVDFVDFMNESCTAFHAVDAAKRRLEASGFSRLSEDEPWDVTVGGKYFFTRNTTSLIAFTVGGAYQPGNGFTVMGAHSDSPCLKIKPVTCLTKGDALVLNTQVSSFIYDVIDHQSR